MADRITPEQEAALVAAEKAATPAPWANGTEPEEVDSVRVCYFRDGKACEWCIALAGNTIDGTNWDDETKARWKADAELIVLARNAMPALLAEVGALRGELRTAQENWVRLEKQNHKLLCDGAFSIDRDPLKLQPVLGMLQYGEISTGKARECIRLWLAGESSELPDFAEDEQNIDHVRAKLREAEEKNATMSRQLGDFHQLVSESAPLTWAATRDEAGAYAWEKRAARLLESPECAPKVEGGAGG